MQHRNKAEVERMERSQEREDMSSLAFPCLLGLPHQ